jgi:hypothetical protein
MHIGIIAYGIIAYGIIAYGIIAYGIIAYGKRPCPIKGRCFWLKVFKFQ